MSDLSKLIEEFLTGARDPCLGANITEAFAAVRDEIRRLGPESPTQPVAEDEAVTDEMVNRFLNWPLPKSVCPDACAMNRDYPHRIGTHLLTASEAKQMLAYVLAGCHLPALIEAAGREQYIQALKTLLAAAEATGSRSSHADHPGNT